MLFASKSLLFTVVEWCAYSAYKEVTVSIIYLSLSGQDPGVGTQVLKIEMSKLATLDPLGYKIKLTC